MDVPFQFDVYSNANISHELPVSSIVENISNLETVDCGVELDISWVASRTLTRIPKKHLECVIGCSCVVC